VALVLVAAAPTRAAGLGGVISGSLVEKTAGATLRPGAKAYLYKLGGGHDAPAQQAQVDVDGAGKFRFDFVETDAANQYRIGVQYQGAPYFSDTVTFAAGETSRQVSLSVYEPTNDDGVLSLASTSFLVQPDQTRHELVVLELNTFNNRVDRTFVPSTTPRNG